MNEITLEMPIPPSVNRTRRIDWRGHKQKEKWALHCDLFLTAYGPKPLPCGERRQVSGPYQLEILLPQACRLDIDNPIKAVIDYLVLREFTPDDSQLEGYSVRRAPIEHCRITIKGLG
jgi:Holliday junction resolvase RusA-like endonuclease